MRAAIRPPAPAVLAQHGAIWSAEFARQRGRDPTYRFQWKSHDGQRVNRLLLPWLEAMTARHCAYCDGFPLDDVAVETIDHFLPKARYPQLAYDWANLYLACPMCQRCKEIQFDRRIEPDAVAGELLRPDEPDYSFARYFLFNYQTGHIEVNPAASDEDRARASHTIRCFGFNEGSRPRARKRQLGFFESAPAADRGLLEEWPYRFLFD